MLLIEGRHVLAFRYLAPRRFSVCISFWLQGTHWGFLVFAVATLGDPDSFLQKNNEHISNTMRIDQTHCFLDGPSLSSG